MADFYTRAFTKVDAVNPVDYLFKEQTARLAQEANDRAIEKLRIQQEDNERAKEYLKIQQKNSDRSEQEYLKNVEGNRAISNLFQSYKKEGKATDFYGKFGEDLANQLIEIGTKEATAKGISIFTERSKEADRDAERKAQLADMDFRYQRSQNDINARAQNKFSFKKLEIDGEDRQVKLDSQGNVAAVWNGETGAFEPYQQPQKGQEAQTASKASFWGNWGSSAEEAAPQLSQGAQDIQRELAAGNINQAEAQDMTDYLKENGQYEAPKEAKALPQSAPQGGTKPLFRTGSSLIDAPFAGVDEFATNQAAGLYRWLGDAMAKGSVIDQYTGLSAPETAQYLQALGDGMRQTGQGIRSAYGVDTTAENILATAGGIIPGVGKQVGAFGLMGPLGLGVANIPDIKNAQVRVEEAGGGAVQQGYAGAAQGIIDTVGGSIASEYMKAAGVIKSALAEGGTEAAQEMASILGIDLMTAVKDPTFMEAMQRTGEAGAYGALGGAFFPGGNRNPGQVGTEGQQLYTAYEGETVGDGAPLEPSAPTIGPDGIVERTGVANIKSEPLMPQEPTSSLFVPQPAEIAAYGQTEGTGELILPSQNIIRDVSHLHELSDYYEPKPVGTMKQSIQSGGDILPKKVGPFDFSGNKTTASGILTPEIKLDVDVGPVIATDPDGFQLRIPSSPKGTTTRAEVNAQLKNRWKSQRGAIILKTPVASTPSGLFLKQRQKNIEEASLLNLDRYFHVGNKDSATNRLISGFTQNTTFLTTAAQDFRNQVDDPNSSEADKYYATAAWEASNAILNQGDQYHAELKPMVDKATSFMKFKPEEQRVAASILKQAQIAKSTQPNFDEAAFYNSPIVPVGKNQFRVLTDKERQAIAASKETTNLVAKHLAESQVAIKQNKLHIERRKLAQTLKQVAPRVADLDRMKWQGQQLPPLSPQEQVALQELEMFDSEANARIGKFSAEMQRLQKDWEGSPFSPMIRQGKYAVVMKDSNDKQLFFALRKTSGEQKALVRQLAKANPNNTVKPYMLKDSTGDQAGASLGSISGAIAKAEKLADFDSMVRGIASRVQGYSPAELHDVSKELSGLLGSLQNDTKINGQGFLTHLLPADNIVKTINPVSGQEEIVPLPGYESDPAKALMAYVQKAAFFNSRGVTDSVAQSKISSLPESDTKKFLKERLDYQMGRKGGAGSTLEYIGNQAQMFHVMSTIGLRFSSAVNNMVGVTLVTYPQLSLMNGARKKKGLPGISPEANMISSSKLATELGLFNADKIVAKYLKSADPKVARLGQALQQARKEGIFNFDASTEWQSLSRADESTTERVARGAMAMFTMAEHQANRTSFISYFKALDGVYPSFVDQYNEAKNQMRSVNPYNSKGNRPVFSRGVGRIPYTFKGYSGQQLRLWRTWLGQSFKGDPDAMGAVARAFAGIIAVVGVNGLPFAQDTIKAMQAIGGVSARKMVADNTDELMADGLFYGAIATAMHEAGAPSVTLSGSLAAGEWVPRGSREQQIAALATGSYSRYLPLIGGGGNPIYGADSPEDAAMAGLTIANAAAGKAASSIDAFAQGQYENSKGKPLRDENGRIIEPDVFDTAAGIAGFQPYEKAVAGQKNYERNMKK
jgi:hypothetical protein